MPPPNHSPVGNRAVILLSGGLDSATVAAIARHEGYALHALSFRYGQRHTQELQRAAELAKAFAVVEHKIAEIDLRLFGGSALTDAIEVPKDRDEAAMSADIPVTYVPARNTIFLSFALAWAEVLKAYDIFIGVNAVDYSGYPDCRPGFIRAFEETANLATAYGVEAKQRIRIHTPLINLSKADIIRKGISLGVDYAHTLSCYDPDEDGRACGRCDACKLRQKGFADNGLQDPAIYQ